MIKQIFALALLVVCAAYSVEVSAQTNKNKKTRYYQNNPKEEEDFNIKGFFTDEDAKEVEKAPVEDEYDVKIKRNERDTKYQDEKRVIRKEKAEVVEEAPAPREPRQPRARSGGYYTSYGEYRPYNENRDRYDRYYGSGDRRPVEAAPAPPPPPSRAKPVKRQVRKEKEIKMTSEENEYQTTVVKKRYTNLDVLCDDLDLAKIQRPVFKGICSECSRDVDAIIVNKNMSSLEKNYKLKQCYYLRDKRLRETLDDDQYKKWLRIKDADEYLILTRDLELKDGVNK
ncbi:MAG: hypothetical protein JNJ58_02770 [Chitinophagaceae bacterium]|nr:hypothetical protein [Chitinophagaceae bacterium]